MTEPTCLEWESVTHLYDGEPVSHMEFANSVFREHALPVPSFYSIKFVNLPTLLQMIRPGANWQLVFNIKDIPSEDAKDGWRTVNMGWFTSKEEAKSFAEETEWHLRVNDIFDESIDNRRTE